MPSFLESVAELILSKHASNFDSLCVVFTNRRACTWFRKTLSEKIERPTLMPQILAFEDFVTSLSPSIIPDPISLTFSFYPVFASHFPGVAFERYFSRAGNLISDFDELDRHMVDADALYKGLYELKAIDETIAGWIGDEHDSTPMRTQFIELWEKMGALYHDFRKRLQGEGQAYMGMAMRNVADDISRDLKIPWEHVVFAGFNAMSRSEETIIRSIVENGKGDFFTDMDRAFSDDPSQEAGKFFRKIRSIWNPSFLYPPTADFESIAKKITITGVPKQVAQAKFAGLAVREIVKTETDPSRIAIVLADESLLLPVLESIPGELADINVTMGFPLQNTSIHSLFESVIALQDNFRKKGKVAGEETACHFRDVSAILMHPLIRRMDHEGSGSILAEIQTANLVWIGREVLSRGSLAFLFRPWDSIKSAIASLDKLCEKIVNSTMASAGESVMESEYVLQYRRLIRLMHALDGKEFAQAGLGTFSRIFPEIIRQARIPFSGEPLKGLQIMGLLETRSLDFDHVVICSVNEGILPPSGRSGSLIPHSLRKAFDMPVIEDREAIFAWHFFRLLQRSKNIELIYNTEAGKTGSGEKSRFIRQIEYEIATRYKDKIAVESRIRAFPALGIKRKPVAIDKTPEVMKEIESRLADPGLSPTSLISWLHCPLQFYFSKILQLRETRVQEETLEAGTFGEVLHRSLEILFELHKNNEITSRILAAMPERIEHSVKKAFAEKAGIAQTRFGYNHLLFRVICDLLKELLNRETEFAPFVLHNLESRLECEIDRNGKKVKIGGYVDRMDEAGGSLRIVDYKTGAPRNMKISSWEKVKENPFETKEAFQVAAYMWLYKKANPGAAVPRAGVIWFRALSRGFSELQTGNNSTLQPELDGFGEFLNSIFDEMLDATTPIVQTSDLERCNHCSFAGICETD